MTDLQVYTNQLFDGKTEKHHGKALVSLLFFFF